MSLKFSLSTWRPFGKKNHLQEYVPRRFRTEDDAPKVSPVTTGLELRSAIRDGGPRPACSCLTQDYLIDAQ